MAKKISEVSSGEIYNGQKDIRGIIKRHIQWSKRIRMKRKTGSQNTTQKN
jgi:hypothetical protein